MLGIFPIKDAEVDRNRNEIPPCRDLKCRLHVSHGGTSRYFIQQTLICYDDTDLSSVDPGPPIASSASSFAFANSVVT